MARQDWRFYLRRYGPMLLFALVGAMAMTVVIALQAFAQEAAVDAEEVNTVPTNMIMWSAIIGFFLPLAIEVPKRQGWPSWVKGLFAFACCLGAAVGTAYFSGSLREFKDVATAALFVTFTALGSYKLLWAPSGIAGGVNNATNPGPHEQVVVVQNPPPA